MTGENAHAKGQRYLASGGLTIDRLTDRIIEARCRGDHGEVYRLGFTPGLWWCECPTRIACAHLYALWAVAVRPGSQGHLGAVVRAVEASGTQPVARIKGPASKNL